MASFILPLLVLGVALVVAWQLREQGRQDIERLVQADFDTRVLESAGILRERLRGYEQVLHATAGLFAASRSVELDEFQAFVSQLDVSGIPGLQGIGFVHADRGGASASRLVYFEPRNEGLAIPGSDTFAEPSRKPAMIAARETGGIAIANKQRLPEENANAIQGGYRMYLPVFRHGADVRSLDGRRSGLEGWIFAAFAMEGLMANVAGGRDDLVIDVYDGDDMADDTLLFDTSTDRVGGESDLKLLRRTALIEAGGYAWTLSAKALPNFATPLATSDLRLRTHIGIAASMLLAWVTWIALHRRIRTLQTQEDLRAAKQRAEEANAAKSRFLAAASHDLRQPIHALGLFVSALQSLSRAPKVEANEVATIAARLQSALGALSGLLDALLDISRLDAGTVSVKRRATSINDLLAGINETFSGPAAEKGLELRIVPSSLWVDTDPILLQRVLGNLVSNALRYTPQGRILVGCRRRGKEMVTIQVWDTGIGIAPDQLKAIFDEFYQVGNRARDREKGLGLGLAIVRRSADLLDATVSVESQPGRGSVFSLTLPQAPIPAADTDAQSEVPPVPLAPLKVLAIDDDEAVLQAVHLLLECEGHHVAIASSVNEAIALVQQDDDIDLILADYRLGDETTGVDAIRAVRKCMGRTVPAALITGDTSPERIREASASGLPLLHKPLDALELQELMRELTES